MAFCGEASTWAKVSLVLMIIALGIHATGYGTNYWTIRYTARDKLNFGIGLWKMTNCSGSYKAPCKDYDFPDSFKNESAKCGPQWVPATQAMESCAMITIFVSMVCLIFYVGHQRSRTRGMAFAILTTCFLAAAFSIFGMVVWIACMPTLYFPGWSMGLTVFAFTLSITAGILLTSDIREYDYKDMLKVGGEFDNLPVVQEPAASPPSNELYEEKLDPIIVPQNPMAAPTFQYLQYDRRRDMDGF